MVRELHVYGNMTPINNNINNINNVQHRGFGKKLLKIAEEISYKNGFNKIAVISGVGVRQYYHKLGYELVDTYMIKNLNYNKFNTEFNFVIFIIISIILYAFSISLSILKSVF
jgi:hypothetical protein